MSPASAPDHVGAAAGAHPSAPCSPARSPLGTFAECPQCGGRLHPEHAHFRCGACGWRDSCCD